MITNQYNIVIIVFFLSFVLHKILSFLGHDIVVWCLLGKVLPVYEQSKIYSSMRL